MFPRLTSAPFCSTGTLLIAAVFSADMALADPGANWPRWRGPHDNGSNETGAYPIAWDASINVLWKAPLPGKGCSTPIVWNERIYVTAPVNGQDALLAYDWSGRALWQTPLGPEKPGKNKNGSGCNPSPATDGTAIFTYFKSGSLAAFEMDGRERWKTNLIERFGKDTLYWDYGSSPVLTEKNVVMTVMHHGESYVAAFDKITGAMSWKVARNFVTPTEGDHSYATPLVLRHEDKEALLVWGGEHLTAHDATTGATLWTCGDFNPEAKKNWVTVASPVVAGSIAVVPHGRGSRLHGIKLGGTGDLTGSHRMWVREDTGSFVPTPLEYKGRIYLLRDRGQIVCIDPANGKNVWAGDLPKAAASYYSSPVAADGKLYAAREDGVVFVAKIDGAFEILSENNMGEPVIASPVPVGNRLLIRGEKHLFAIGLPK